MRAVAAGTLLAALGAFAPYAVAAPRSAKVCATCHGPIQRAWKASAKSSSWTNPVFQAGYVEARETRGAAAAQQCLACHVPLAAAMNDTQVTDPVAQEGITCNFCHNVSAVEASPRAASYEYDAAHPNLMRGPYSDAAPGSAHDAAFSESMTKGDFCASCHWGENDKGVAFETTYPEWKRSRAAAAGQTCQSCHMPPAPGKASPLAKKQRSEVYAHSFIGPRTAGGLDSIASVGAAVQEGRLRLTVRNSRAGHSLPGGGHSMRAITLEAAFFDAGGKEIARVPVAMYGTEFADSSGAAPVPKWLAAKVSRSRSIPADSSIEEWAPIPAGAKRALALLTYHPIAPAYRARLLARRVDLAGRDPVVIARAEVTLP